MATKKRIKLPRSSNQRYWLLKSEPSTYSINDLKEEKTTYWEGVRNYAARKNLLSMKKNDLAFFYHSVVRPPHIAGITKIIKTAYPDHTQFDPASKYFDPKASADNPRWYMVDIELLYALSHPITIDEIRKHPQLASMELLKQSRLSVQSVSQEEFQTILKIIEKFDQVVFQFSQ